MLRELPSGELLYRSYRFRMGFNELFLTIFVCISPVILRTCYYFYFYLLKAFIILEE
jgi:hypothetical protein